MSNEKKTRKEDRNKNQGVRDRDSCGCAADDHHAAYVLRIHRSPVARSLNQR